MEVERCQLTIRVREPGAMMSQGTVMDSWKTTVNHRYNREQSENQGRRHRFESCGRAERGGTSKVARSTAERTVAGVQEGSPLVGTRGLNPRKFFRK